MLGKNVVDQNGRTKTVLKGLLLSKERECYKGIEKQQETEKIQFGQEQYQNTFQNKTEETNLPVKQNRFSRFFSQIRSRFSKQNRNNNIQKEDTLTDNLQQNEYKEKQKEKKSWELEPEEKVKIQKTTAQIAEKHREQEKQQKQIPLQQEEYQNVQNINQTMQQQIPARQPPIDMGGMEL